jgi:rhodanese-related sulfurtransferase
MTSNKDLIVIDVREAAEYASNHISSTINIPLGDLESHINDFNKDDDIFFICRTGNRSGMAASKLTELGFNHVYNVVPGMSEWTGKAESNEK